MSTGKALSLLAPLATGAVKYWYKRARSRSIINQLFTEGFLDDKGDIRRWGGTVGKSQIQCFAGYNDRLLG